MKAVRPHVSLGLYYGSRDQFLNDGPRTLQGKIVYDYSGSLHDKCCKKCGIRFKLCLGDGR